VRLPKETHPTSVGRRAGVVIPWKSDSSALRVEACKTVVEYLRSVTALRVVRSDCGEPWSPGRARNYGARRLLWDADPVVFVDADTIVPPDQIASAIRLAREAPGLVYGYTLYLRQRPGRLGYEDEFMAPPSMGCVAISRESFELVGGFDERFVGWGYEDVEFAQRCAERWPLRRVDGVATHLWHGSRRDDDSPLDADADDVAANLELFQHGDRVGA